MSGCKSLSQGSPGRSVPVGAACLIFVVAAAASVAPAAEWFVAPAGSAGGAGTINDPWDISVLNPGGGASSIAPGDTVWLRGGTYLDANRNYDNQGFNVTLAGSSGGRITIRNYAEERAIIDPGITLIPGAAYLDIWGLEFRVQEFMDPNNARRSYQEYGGFNATDLGAPIGGVNLEAGTSIRMINNYIHDMTKNSLWLHPALLEEIVVHGNVIRDGGFIGYRPAKPSGNPDGHYGTGIYGGNTGTSLWDISDNIVEDNFAEPFVARGYSTTGCRNITYEGNFFKPRWIAGDPDQSSNGSNFAGGGGVPGDAQNMTFSQNLHYGSSVTVSSETYVFYDPGPCETWDFVVTDNTMVRGQFNWWDDLDPNIYYSPLHHNLTTSGNVEWNDPNVPWTDPAIVSLRGNDFEANRANLAIVQPGSSAASIAVNFGSWLSNGQAFELKDPDDLWGLPVFSGTYDGNDIMVPVGAAEYASFVAFQVGHLGDFNNDGSITSADVNALWPLFGMSWPDAHYKYDVNDDDQVTFADAQMLVATIVDTSMADTNLDHIVNILDLGALAAKYNKAGVFSNGDTNGDGMITIMDLGRLAADYNKTFSPIPEPATLALLALGGAALLRRRR